MFYEDNSFRDMFIYGSIVTLAALALPMKRAHAAEFFLCGDGRNLEVTNTNRAMVMSQDACVVAWVELARRPADKAAIAQVADKPLVQVAAYQIQTAALEPLVNAEEVPAGRIVRAKSAGRKPHESLASVEELGGANERTPAKSKAAARSLRTAKGLVAMGDGIFAR